MKTAIKVVLVCTTFAIISIMPTEAQPNPGSIVGLWPLDDKAQLADVSSNGANRHLSTSGYGTTAAFLPGPYGWHYTSFTVTQPYTSIGYVNGVVLTDSFTMGLYFYTRDCNGKGGIASFWKHPWSRLSLVYVRDFLSGACKLEIWAGSNELFMGSRSEHLIIEPRMWNFIALTYHIDDSQPFNRSGVLNVYKNSNAELATTFRTNLTTENGTFWNDPASTFYVGHAKWGWDPYYMVNADMQPSDALACVVVYRTALRSPSEIKQLSETCTEENKRTFVYPTGTTTRRDFNHVIDWYQAEAYYSTASSVAIRHHLIFLMFSIIIAVKK